VRCTCARVLQKALGIADVGGQAAGVVAVQVAQLLQQALLVGIGLPCAIRVCLNSPHAYQVPRWREPSTWSRPAREDVLLTELQQLFDQSCILRSAHMHQYSSAYASPGVMGARDGHLNGLYADAPLL
jgi:hypothetical protein